MQLEEFIKFRQEAYAGQAVKLESAISHQVEKMCAGEEGNDYFRLKEELARTDGMQKAYGEILSFIKAHSTLASIKEEIERNDTFPLC